MDFDPKYTEITYEPGKGSFVLRDTRTGKTKSVKGVTTTIHSVFHKGRPSEQDGATQLFAEAARKKGTSIHQGVSEWIDSPKAFKKIPHDSQMAASLLIAQFPPSQGWVYHHDVPVSDYKKYASEIDILVTNEHTNEVHIIDLKTGAWREGEYGAQLSFYKRMYELGNPDQKVAGIWGLRTKEDSRGFVKAHEYTPQQVDDIFYRGGLKYKKRNMNKGVPAHKSNVLQHFKPADSKAGSMVSRPVTFFDVETGPSGEILQIGAVKGVFNKNTKQFQVIDRFARHFTGDPNTYDTQEWAMLQETHGITPETAALRGKKHGRWGERHRNAFKAFVGDSALAGHNIEAFDIPAVFGKDVPTNDIIDTLHIARNIRGGGYNKLGQLFALTTGQSMHQAGFLAHDALGDVMANARMFEGWLNRDKSPFQEYSRLVLDNPGMSTIFRNTYTGAEVRMKDDELTPDDLLSMNIGTGMGIEDLSDMLDEEKGARLDRNPPPGFAPVGQPANWSALDRAEQTALLNALVRNTGTMGEYASTLSSSVHTHTQQIRNNMLRSMVDYTDDDARGILQRLYGNDIQVDRDIKTLGTMRRAKYRAQANKLIEKAAAHGIDVSTLPQFHDLGLVAGGAEATFTTGGDGIVTTTPLDGRAIVQQARVGLGEMLNRKGAVTKAHNLARYADYFGLHSVAAKLRAVTNEQEFFDARMGYKSERNDMEEQEAFEKRREHAVLSMRVAGHQEEAAKVAELADSEEKLMRARKQGQEELAAYTKKVDLFHRTLEGLIAAPGQYGAAHDAIQDKGRSMVKSVWAATGGFMPSELQPAGGYFIDSAFDIYKSETVRRNAGLQIASNIGGGAFAGAASMVGAGPVAMAIGGLVGAGTQIIPSVFQGAEARMMETTSLISGKLNFWSGMFTVLEAPFKMLARVTRDLTRGFVGLSASLGGIMIGGLNKMDSAREHYASLTSLSHGQYQNTFAMDAWLGLKEGSVVGATEEAVQNMRTFLTSGEGAMKWANLALSGSIQGYLQAGDYDGVMNMVNEVVAQGHADPSRQRDIMANFMAAFGKGTLSDMVQKAWTHGVTDVRNFGSNANSRIHYRNLSDAWQGRVNDTRAEWGMVTHGFDNAWMKITVRMWEAFGRDISNVVLDIMNAFGDEGLAGGMRVLKEKIGELWAAFTSEGGIGGINLDAVLDTGKKILAAILHGIADGIDLLTPYVAQAFGSLAQTVINVVAHIAGQLEPLIAHMSTFQINPTLFEAMAALTTDPFAAPGLFKQAMDEGFVRSAGMDIGKAIVEDEFKIDDPMKFLSRGGSTRDSFVYFSLHKNTQGKASVEGLWDYIYANRDSGDGLIRTPDGKQYTVEEIERLRTNGIGRTGGHMTEAERKYNLDKFYSIAGSIFANDLTLVNRGLSDWEHQQSLDYLGYLNKADETDMLQKSVAAINVDSAARHAAEFMGESTGAGIRALANTLTIGIEAKDDRMVVGLKDALGKTKDIVVRTGTEVKEVIELAVRGAAAEGVH